MVQGGTNGMRNHGLPECPLLGMRQDGDIRSDRSTTREWASAMQALRDARQRVTNGGGATRGRIHGLDVCE